MVNRNSNKVLKNVAETMNDVIFGEESASLTGVGLKTIYFVILTLIGGFGGITLFRNYPEAFIMFLAISGIVGMICAFVAMSKYKYSLVFGSIYCLCEGMFLGVISYFCEEFVPGVVLTTMVATIALVFVCGFMYLSGLIKVNSKFRRFLMLFAISFLVTSLVMFLLSLFGVIDLTSFYTSLLVGFITVVLASLFLINDFDYAYQLIKDNGPKELEWMVAFGIAYTVLWIYYEILRIVIIIFARRD